MEPQGIPGAEERSDGAYGGRVELDHDSPVSPHMQLAADGLAEHDGAPTASQGGSYEAAAIGISRLGTGYPGRRE